MSTRSATGKLVAPPLFQDPESEAVALVSTNGEVLEGVGKSPATGHAFAKTFIADAAGVE